MQEQDEDGLGVDVKRGSGEVTEDGNSKEGSECYRVLELGYIGRT